MSRKSQSHNKKPAEINLDNNGFYSAALVRVDTDGYVFDVTELSTFLLNPSTYEENKSANWIAHNIPGQSDPILQWVSSGSRTLSFDALITKDTSHFLKKSDSGGFLDGLQDKALNVIGDVASSFAGVNIPSLANLLNPPTGSGENLSIAPYLNYYRSLLYPRYKTSTFASTSSSGELSQSPPLVILYTGKTFSSFNSLPAPGDSITATTDLWVVTNLKIKVTKQLPNLTPMEAIVSFNLLQYSITSRGDNDFDASLSQDDSPVGGLVNAVTDLFG